MTTTSGSPRTRRANGDGSTPRQRTDGRWQVNFTWRDAQDVRQQCSVMGKTKAEVVAKAKLKRREIEDGIATVRRPETLQVFAQHWLDVSLDASGHRAETTKLRYRSALTKHLLGSPLAHMPLTKVTGPDVEEWRAGLRKTTRAGGVQPLADTTLQYLTVALHQVFATAVRKRLIATNPVSEAEPMRKGEPEKKWLSEAEAARVVAEAYALTDWGSLVELLLATGLRSGEAAGLCWTDVNFDTKRLTVRHTLSRIDRTLTMPKTRTSRRTIALNSSAMRALRAAKVQQAEWALSAGPHWRNELGLVFTKIDGDPLWLQNVLVQLQPAFHAAEVTEVNLHTLRHTAASIMLVRGVPLKTVSVILGHASVMITGDLYGHVAPEVAAQAMDVLGDALGGRD